MSSLGPQYVTRTINCLQEFLWDHMRSHTDYGIKNLGLERSSSTPNKNSFGDLYSRAMRGWKRIWILFFPLWPPVGEQSSVHPRHHNHACLECCTATYQACHCCSSNFDGQRPGLSMTRGHWVPAQRKAGDQDTRVRGPGDQGRRPCGPVACPPDGLLGWSGARRRAPRSNRSPSLVYCDRPLIPDQLPK